MLIFVARNFNQHSRLNSCTWTEGHLCCSNQDILHQWKLDHWGRSIQVSEPDNGHTNYKVSASDIFFESCILENIFILNKYFFYCGISILIFKESFFYKNSNLNFFFRFSTFIIKDYAVVQFETTGKTLTLGRLEIQYGAVLNSQRLLLQSNNIILHPGSLLDLSGEGHSAGQGQGAGSTVSTQIIYRLNSKYTNYLPQSLCKIKTIIEIQCTN